MSSKTWQAYEIDIDKDLFYSIAFIIKWKAYRRRMLNEAYMPYWWRIYFWYNPKRNSRDHWVLKTLHIIGNHMKFLADVLLKLRTCALRHSSLNVTFPWNFTIFLWQSDFKNLIKGVQNCLNSFKKLKGALYFSLYSIKTIFNTDFFK